MNLVLKLGKASKLQMLMNIHFMYCWKTTI